MSGMLFGDTVYMSAQCRHNFYYAAVCLVFEMKISTQVTIALPTIRVLSMF